MIKIDFVADFPTCSVVGNVRQKNEDKCGYALKTPNGDLFVVCDGMGGHVGGARASQIGVDSIIEFLSGGKYPDAKQALNDALVFANGNILKTATDDPSLKGMGTTACVLLIQGDEAWIAHAGDSRIYLYEQKGKYLHRITTDHSYVQKVLVEQEGMSEEAAEEHPKKNIILNALGIKADFKSEVVNKPIFPAKGDIFLICSDGLTGMVNDPTIESVLTTETSLHNKVAKLIELATVEGKGKDNVTVQLIQITQSPWGKSVYVDKNPKWRQTPSSATKRTQLAKMSTKKKLILALAAVVVAIGLIVGGYNIGVSVLNKQIETARTDLETAKSTFNTCDTAYTKAVSEYKTTKGNYDRMQTAFDNENGKKTKDAAENAMKTAKDAMKTAENAMKTAEKAKTNASDDIGKKETDLDGLQKKLENWKRLNIFKNHKK